MNVIIAVGLCIHISHLSLYEGPVEKILAVEGNKFTTEVAQKTIYGWKFKGQENHDSRALNPAVINVECPPINWATPPK